MPVCLVIGAGAGIGGTVGRRFARDGYHAVLCRRSNEEGLARLVNAIEDDGGKATGYLLNAVEDDAIEDRVESVERDIGPIEVVIFNLGAQTGNHSLADTSLRAFEIGWRMATFALFRTAKAVFPHMQARERGTLIVTSSTA
jgi:NAD(P)-dependent dehydrogenase (short-subunit alcohol dehydrogenase family)